MLGLIVEVRDLLDSFVALGDELKVLFPRKGREELDDILTSFHEIHQNMDQPDLRIGDLFDLVNDAQRLRSLVAATVLAAAEIDRKRAPQLYDQINESARKLHVLALQLFTEFCEHAKP